MTGGAVLRAASGGVLHRRVQTVVVFVLVTAAAAAAVLGLSLATTATAFSSAFAASHGAHLAVTIDSAKVTSAELAATRHLSGVTRVAGPYPETTITLAAARPSVPPTGSSQPAGGGQSFSSGRRPSSATGSPGQHPAQPPPPGSGAGAPAPAGGEAAGGLTVVGRASRSTPLDEPRLTRGHWPTGRGQIVVADYAASGLRLGELVSVTSAPGQPRLRVVGFALSVAHDEDAWVVPSQLAALRTNGAPAQQQMLYTFTHAATAHQIRADLAALKAALPADAITASVSWLDTANSAQAQAPASAQRINTPFPVTIALIAVVLAALITANVASAAVVASYRRIGILKGIGFTPAQVTATYLVQIGIPALAGAIAGTVLGDRWVVPLLKYGGSTWVVARHVPVWINLSVPVGMLVLTGLAVLVPALRAGRLSAVAVIAAGQAPRAGHGYAAHRLAGRLPLPPPVTIGLAAPFARPARSAVTLASITFGLTAVVLAVGVTSSVSKINGATSQWGQDEIVGAPHAFTASQQRRVVAALRAQPETLRYVAAAWPHPTPPGTATISGHLPAGKRGTRPPGGSGPVVSVPGVGSHVPVAAFAGDAAGFGWDIISGTWYQRPGQVVVNTADPATAGLSVGQTIHITYHGVPITARISGEVYTPGPGLPALLTSWQTLGGNTAGLAINQYLVQLRPGVNRQHYEMALGRALGPRFAVLSVGLGPGGGVASFGYVDASLFRRLTVLVAVLAGLGVFNTVLMLTRERIHDLGVLRAVGMTPRQIIAMVICWVIAPALAAAAIALPAGIALHDLVVHAMGRDQPTVITFATTPAGLVHVYTTAQLALLALAGLAIATIGALGPATWAAASKTATALRTE